MAMIKVLKESNENGIRTLAAIMFRRKLTKGEQKLLLRLSPTALTTLKDGLLQALIKETDRSVILQICEPIIYIAVCLAEAGSSWETL